MIFINYRIDDSLDMAARLDADLAREFGSENIFRDKTGIPPGESWPDRLRREVESRPVMLVIIGPQWQEVRFESGPRKGFPRLSDPDDWVRKEILAALSGGRTVVPVLLHSEKMPEEGWLKTCGLQELYRKQAARLRTEPDYLNDLAALAGLLRRVCPALPAREQIRVDGCERPEWPVLALYPLQPAPHFAGREPLLAELVAWGKDPNTPVRVWALVAAGGTGKTALAERVHRALPDSSPFGVFVWSFYECSETESFLQEAYRYVARVERNDPTPANGLFERLQGGLSGNVPHVFILDGLERIQSDGASGRIRGVLEDPPLRRLLGWLAAGKGTRAKALITSRFPLPDLAPWASAGFRETPLDDLDPAATRRLFRDRGVRGDDKTLDALAEDVHRHALTVDVLGSYLATFHGGDPTRAPSFDPGWLADTDPTTAKLHRVLTSYAEKLLPRERDLLARLSVFPRGVGVTEVGYLADAKGDVAGSLANCSPEDVGKLLERLRQIGLVFRYCGRSEAAFTAHPFLRGFFAKLLSARGAEEIHDTVRGKMVEDLLSKPRGYSTDPLILDRYERLIETTRLAGKPEIAYGLFQTPLGGYRHLAHFVGNFSLGLRVISSFSADGSIAGIDPRLSPELQASLVNQWGLFATPLGDLATGAACFDTCRRLARQLRLSGLERAALAHLAKARQLAGRFPDALQAAMEFAATIEERSWDHTWPEGAHFYLGAALGALGRTEEALREFRSGRDATGDTSNALYGLWEGEFRLLLRQLRRTTRRARQDRKRCTLSGSLRDVAFFDGLLARLLASTAPSEARLHLASARAFGNSSSNLEVQLPCFIAAAEIARREGNVALAESEVFDGLQIADSCGFGQWSIDLRLELSLIHIAAENWQAAIEPADDALARSEHPECQYAWGVADALHQLGAARVRLGETSAARNLFKRALECRRSLRHPGTTETEAELKRLGR